VQRARDDYQSVAVTRVAAGEVELWWSGGEPVSMAAVSAPAAGVSRIGPVYTPPAMRRRGFASAVTAAAAGLAQAGGAREIVLYADLSNQTANAIYQAIGFCPDHHALELRFE
jgi:predicted GNAT family acetyltransferase